MSISRTSSRLLRPSDLPEGLAGEGGIYALIVDVPRALRATVGSLGPVKLPPGRYIYAGSAQRGLAHRLARHFRRDKPSRWHIDSVTCRAAPSGAAVWRLPKSAECRLARLLCARWPMPVDGFGSSDCRCPAHFVGPVDEDWLKMAEARLGRSLTWPLSEKP